MGFVIKLFIETMKGNQQNSVGGEKFNWTGRGIEFPISLLTMKGSLNSLTTV